MKKEELEQKMKGKEKHVSCLHCPETEDILNMETRLYNGFGGWMITKNGDEYFTSELDEFEQWENIKQLKEIEEEAKLSPNDVWQAILFLPLRGATYQRSDCGHWVLIETNEGFA